MENPDLQHIEEDLGRANRELNVLYEISAAMRTTLELEHILYIILTGVTSHSGLGYNRALLFLLNSRANALECKMVIGPESGEHANKIWEYIENSNQRLDDLIQADKISQTIHQSSLYKALRDVRFYLNDKNLLLVQAYDRGRPWHVPPELVNDFAQDPLFKYFQTRELVIMPLRAKDKVNGLIIADNIYTQKPITDEDMKIFTMLANQAGLAIENSQLYEMVVVKSQADSLTNLWNHGYFQDKLSEEIQRHRQAKEPLSLVMIDIDNFKKLNDTYGHQHGDVILKKIARLFREQSREKDFACRYGGEEFAIILEQTNKNQAFDSAERLRKRVENYTFPGATADQSMKITVSIGIATFPDDADNKEDLIAKADKAMYIAKFSGKNKTVLIENNYGLKPQP